MAQLVWTEPVIINTGKRVYVKFYLNGKLVKTYNGDKTALKVFPNRIHDPQKRIDALSN